MSNQNQISVKEKGDSFEASIASTHEAIPPMMIAAIRSCADMIEVDNLPDTAKHILLLRLGVSIMEAVEFEIESKIRRIVKEHLLEGAPEGTGGVKHFMRFAGKLKEEIGENPDDLLKVLETINDKLSEKLFNNN